MSVKSLGGKEITDLGLLCDLAIGTHRISPLEVSNQTLTRNRGRVTFQHCCQNNKYNKTDGLLLTLPDKVQKEKDEFRHWNPQLKSHTNDPKHLDVS